MIKKVEWGDVKSSVEHINSELAGAIESLLTSPRMKDRKQHFYRLTYKYADLIVEDGEFRPPCVRLHPGQDHCEHCRPLLADIQSSAIPLGLSLSRSVEVFLKSEWDHEEPHYAPLRLMLPGEPFGVFEVLDTLLSTPFPKPPWSVSAGACSVWILAPLGQQLLPQKLTEATGKKIRQAKEARPSDLIAATVGETWTADVLLLPDSLVQEIQPGDSIFQALLRIGWMQSSNVRHAYYRIPHDLIGNSAAGGPLPDIYRVATVRHLVDGAKGNVPLFKPANGKDMSGPFSAFKSVLRHALGNVDSPYMPVVMEPVHLTDPGDVGYYSFRCPTVVGVSRPSVRNYADVPLYVREDLLAQECAAVVDPVNSRFFAQKAKEDVIEADELPMSDFYNGETSPKLYLKSPFLISGVRIVRAAAHVMAAGRQI